MSRMLSVLIALGVVALAPLAAQQRTQGALRAGDLAPDFTLEPRGGGAPIRLSSFRGVSSVALVFGSYT